MQQSRGGMGTRKHGKSGHATKSPRLRHAMRLEAERNERKDRSQIKRPFDSVKDMFKRR
jgi:hypothetical protein